MKTLKRRSAISGFIKEFKPFFVSVSFIGVIWLMLVVSLIMKGA